jgi:thiamine-monophosphate kinase
LSDIAAMGGEPVACFLSLALPARLTQKWVDDFLRGFNQLARRWRVPLAGGDVSAASAITADIVLAGQAPAGRAVLRSGARSGDRIYVTGALGGSAAALKRLYAGEHVRPSRSSPHFYPEPRLEVGLWLRRRNLATAMIDVSDGISVDLAHICQESGVAAKINADALPIALGADLESALHGGEDYELLFTAPPRAKIPARIGRVRITEIGAIHPLRGRGPAIQIARRDGRLKFLSKGGWSHFAQNK